MSSIPFQLPSIVCVAPAQAALSQEFQACFDDLRRRQEFRNNKILELGRLGFSFERALEISYSGQVSLVLKAVACAYELQEKGVIAEILQVIMRDAQWSDAGAMQYVLWKQYHINTYAWRVWPNKFVAFLAMVWTALRELPPRQQ